MPSGDAQRAWFPEMLSALSTKWNDGMSWEDCGLFSKEMTEFRKKLRAEKNINSPRMFCRKCNQYHKGNLIPITVRSLIFALKKAGKISDAELKTLDKDWKKYRNKNMLDGYGKPKEQR